MKACISTCLLVVSLVGSAAPALAAPSGLAAALQAALSQHPALRGKRAEVAAKGFVGDSARAQRYPSFSAQASRQDNGVHPVTLQMRQPLWAFGRIDNAIAYADAELTAEEADLVRLQRQLLEQTAVAYARVLGARERLGIATNNVTVLQALHGQIQRRERGQLASQADVRLALARLTQAQAQRHRYEGEYALAQTELLALTQSPVETGRLVPESVTALPEGAELQILAEAESADLRLKMQRIAVAQADENRERSAAKPTLYLQVNQTLNQPGTRDDLRVGVVLEASLDGAGFASRGRSQAAGARLQAAHEDVASTRVELRRNLNSLATLRRLQQSLIESQGQSVDELTEILASYQRQYAAGHKAWLDVLNTQRELTEQQLQRVAAGNEWLIHSLKLAALVGRLDALAAQGTNEGDFPR